MGRALDKIKDKEAFKEGLSYLDYQKKEFMKVRDYVTEILNKNQNILPIKPFKCESGYFIIVDISAFQEIIP